MTSQAELPRDRAALQLALPVITTALGLQLLRLLFVTLPNPFGVYQEWLDGELRGSWAIALGIFGLVALAPRVARALGARRALWVTVGGVALARLAVQLVAHPVARLLVAGLGVLLLLWSVPILVGVLCGRPAGRWLGPSVVAGLAVDTALHVSWGAWDAAWSVDPVAIAAAAALAAVVVAAVARLLAEDPTAGAGILTHHRLVVGERRAGTALPLVGLGPALFLQALLWQNVAAQSVLLGRPQPWVLLLVLLADALALLTAVAAASIPARPGGQLRPLPMVGVPVGWLGWLVTLAAAGGLLVAVVVQRRAPLAGLLLGQAAAGALLGRIGRSAAGQAAGAGVGRVTVAWGGGMLLFATLMLAYYLADERRVPYDNRWLLPLGAAVVGAAGLAAQHRLGRESRRDASASAGLRLAPGGLRALPWLPVVVGVGLLVFPIGLQLGAPAATTSPLGYPVRVMAYNVHGGFDDDGRMNLRAIAADLRASHAEVVGLEEVARGGYTTGSVDMLAWLQRRLRLPYAVYAEESDAGLGNAIVSRRPILASGAGRLPGGRTGKPRHNGYLWADVDLGAGQTVRVIVTHLTSLPAGQGGSAVRVRQVARLLAVWAGHPATLLVGDLNATPDSPEIGLLRQAGLQDAWLAAAGRPTDELTLPVDRPAERIDYLWLTADLRATQFQATSSTASDHRGVSVSLQPHPTS